MKINVDRPNAGFAAEKNDKRSKTTHTVKSDTSAPVVETKDELELTQKKAAVLDAVRETNIGSAASVEFDASEIPMFKQKLHVVNNYILSNPVEALSAQANLNSETVAGLIG